MEIVRATVARFQNAAAQPKKRPLFNNAMISETKLEAGVSEKIPLVRLLAFRMGANDDEYQKLKEGIGPIVLFYPWSRDAGLMRLSKVMNKRCG